MAVQCSEWSISVVVPVYGCATCLAELCRQLDTQLSKLSRDHEIILVDDRSPDESWPHLEQLRTVYPGITSIRLSRNFGQHLAITAGLAAAKGDVTIVMDCDLQDPPALIPAMLAKLAEGYDLVLARRVSRHHSHFRVLAAKIYFSLLSRATGQSIDGTHGTFSALSRKVVDAFLLFKEKDRHYLFILRWLGFKVGEVDFEHAERHSGSSSYNLSKLISHAIDGIMFQSTIFLRWIAVLGIAFALLGILVGADLVWNAIFHAVLPGWTSITVLLLLSTGAILLSIGIVGLYTAKLFDQMKQRPLYIVDELIPRQSTWRKEGPSSEAGVAR